MNNGKTSPTSTKASISTISTSSSSSVSKTKVKGRTFQCVGYPDCTMTFTRSEHLARHIRKHTGERPFECTHCSRKFSRLDNLRQHKQTVHAHERIVMSDYVDGKNSQSKSKRKNDDESTKNEKHDTAQHPIQSEVLINAPSIVIDQHTDETYEHNNEEEEAEQQQQQQQQQHHHHHQPKTLARPTQFRPKHRPRPLVLNNRTPVYNDGPYTAPLPISATGSNQFILSPISPSFSTYGSSNNALLSSTPTMATSGQNPNGLPSFEFLTGPRNGESLISPYSSSFNTSSIMSSSNTPLNTSFDLKTPTSNSTFEFIRINGNTSGESTHSMIGNNYENKRKSWLTNVLNNGNMNMGVNINIDQQHSQQYNNSVNMKSNNPIMNHNNHMNHNSAHHYNTSTPPVINTTTETKKLKIESLLNSNTHF